MPLARLGGELISALKGPDHSAQGKGAQRPPPWVCITTNNVALKGQQNLSPLQGETSIYLDNPGRCPGLSDRRPLACKSGLMTDAIVTRPGNRPAAFKLHDATATVVVQRLVRRRLALRLDATIKKGERVSQR
jgi:hypothetical protein